MPAGFLVPFHIFHTLQNTSRNRSAQFFRAERNRFDLCCGHEAYLQRKFVSERCVFAKCEHGF